MLKFVTTAGEFTVELFDSTAPETSANFLRYVDEGFFEGTLFHRVIPGFMIQGGGFTAGLEHKDTHEPIRNEANNGLSNERGTLAMARTSDPHSATSQFFINLVDNDFLNPGPGNAGYAVFGRVTAGMEVVDAIAQQPTTRRRGHDDVPADDVVILSVSRSDQAAGS
jgi:cyclophilin family peptidyl-prolyl cis-trans isomerase